MLVYRTAVGYGLMLSPGRRPWYCFLSLSGRKRWKSFWNCFSVSWRMVMTDRVSFCDYCGRRLKWYENIPVVSWVIQRGRSRCCGKKLPVAYPIVEVTMGLLFVLMMGGHTGPPVRMVLGLVVITMLVFAAVFDVKYMILPDFSTGVLIACAIVLLVVEGFQGGHGGLPVHYVISAIGGAGFLSVLYWLTKGKGMGMGDVKLAVFMGLWLGWPKIVVAFYVAFVTGAVVGGALMLAKKLKTKSLIAFGPFLILGTLVAWWWGGILL